MITAIRVGRTVGVSNPIRVALVNDYVIVLEGSARAPGVEQSGN